MATITFDDLIPKDAVPGIFRTWFGFFGVHSDPAVVIGTTIIASGIFLFVAYFIYLIAEALIVAFFSNPFKGL
jgi:hypothetical protein